MQVFRKNKMCLFICLWGFALRTAYFFITSAHSTMSAILPSLTVKNKNEVKMIKKITRFEAPESRGSGNNFGRFSVSFFEGCILYILAGCNYPTRERKSKKVCSRISDWSRFRFSFLKFYINPKRNNWWDTTKKNEKDQYTPPCQVNKSCFHYFCLKAGQNTQNLALYKSKFSLSLWTAEKMYKTKNYQRAPGISRACGTFPGTSGKRFSTHLAPARLGTATFILLTINNLQIKMKQKIKR